MHQEAPEQQNTPVTYWGNMFSKGALIRMFGANHRSQGLFEALHNHTHNLNTLLIINYFLFLLRH